MTDRRKWIVGIAVLVVLAVVLAALLLRPDGSGTRDGSGAVAEDGVPTRAVGESIFDSSTNPDLSELLGIVGGLFLPDSGLALVERGEIHMVDLASGETRVIGRRGEGPREFGRIWTANHTPRGILVWDTLHRRAVFVAHDGEFLSSQGYRQVSFRNIFISRPVGVGTDGRIVFRDGPDSFGGFGRGRLWDPAWYVVVQGDGEILRIAEARGEEMYYGEHRSDAVTMGHRTFDAATEDHLIIADTDRAAIAVLDWSGSEVAVIPMPPSAQLSAAQVQAGRELRIEQEQEFMAFFRRAAESGQLPARAGRVGDAEVAEAYSDWPINEIAPPIDTLLTDFDARLWVRDYRLPDQDSVTWRVWDIDRPQPLFTVRMDGDDRLLDATGDLLLLRRVDALDVPRAEVRRLTGAPE
ncbi:MAG: hypothetical protein F4Z31_18525 [Gemmatimonadetes bacterium]|nr:hypothetical protein [Gemmatimonadota bacterium]MYA43726.1 hypothetical protein [Gemmatimonadota bacterium]MYE95722.1 hypothetical protein [Gemmatimonadota bacterium]MYJ12407.1 hypothetical protein [Gemmatimonadota bacterium]